MCLLNLCSVSGIDPLSTDNYFGENVVMWGKNIGDAVRDNVGAEAWNNAQQAMVELHGFGDINNKKKNEMVIVAVLQHLWEQGLKSSLLEKLCNRLFT